MTKKLMLVVVNVFLQAFIFKQIYKNNVKNKSL